MGRPTTAARVGAPAAGAPPKSRTGLIVGLLAGGLPDDGRRLAAAAGAGLRREACLEVAHVVGLFNYFTRLADGFGLQVAPELLEAANGGPPLLRADPG